MERVRKAIIPAAGFGTRFLPATKSIPKEMLPIVDRPTIEYVVEEAVASGFEDIIFVTSQGKYAIEDHFDYDYVLEKKLKEQNKLDLLDIVNRLSEMINIASIRQKKPQGLGHAVLVTEPFVGSEAFGVFLGDDIIVGDPPGMKQLLDIHMEKRASVIAVLEVPWETVTRYGIISADLVEGGDGRLYRVREMVEKPDRERAPSNLAIMGRYVLTPGIYEALKRTEPGSGGEIQLTDGLRHLLEDEPLYAYRFKGARYDAGNKLEYLIATIDFALKRSDLGPALRRYLKSLDL